jgi:hypothetical protein
MRQIKVSLADSHSAFVNQHERWGFPDKSSMIRKALDQLQTCLKQERLRQSAELYAEIYQEDRELRALTEQALEDWPE